MDKTNKEIEEMLNDETEISESKELTPDLVAFELTNHFNYNKVGRLIIPIFEEMAAIILEMESTLELTSFIEKHKDHKVLQSNGKRYKTALKASLFYDRDFKKGIISSSNLEIDGKVLPPIDFVINDDQKSNKYIQALLEMTDLERQRINRENKTYAKQLETPDEKQAGELIDELI